MNTDRLPELTTAADTFDRSADFKLALKNGRTIICRLMQGYNTCNDGQLWAMQRSGTLKDSYTAEDAAWVERMKTIEPIGNGAIVKIAGKLYTVKILGDYSDAALFHRVQDEMPRVTLEGKIGGFQ